MTRLKLENIGKCLNVPNQKESSLRKILSELRSDKDNKRWILKDISLEIKKGECIGVVGDNGSGKSTLLNIIAGISLPSEGSLIVNGKISYFLELGIGFQEGLSGKENIFFYGSLLGLKKKEIKKSYQEIISFSGLGEAIEQPINTYSSGMLARLAFSVLAFTNSDILLLDEVMSVGDHSFKQKSANKIIEFKRKGKTILIVSHNTDELLKICDRCILIEEGKVILFDDTKKVITSYINKTNQKNKLALMEQIREESKKYDRSKLFYLYNELNIILESMIEANKENALYQNQDYNLTMSYEELIIERIRLLKKMYRYCKKGNLKTQLLYLNRDLIDTLNNLYEFYENTSYTIQDKHLIGLLINTIKLCPYDNIQTIRLYDLLTQIGLKTLEKNRHIEKEKVLSNIRQVLKEGFKKDKNSKRMLSLIKRIIKLLAKVKRREGVESIIKNPIIQYHNQLNDEKLTKS